jgi:hypothetical protein
VPPHQHHHPPGRGGRGGDQCDQQGGRAEGNGEDGPGLKLLSIRTFPNPPCPPAGELGAARWCWRPEGGLDGGGGASIGREAAGSRCLWRLYGAKLHLEAVLLVIIQTLAMIRHYAMLPYDTLVQCYADLRLEKSQL